MTFRLALPRRAAPRTAGRRLARSALGAALLVASLAGCGAATGVPATGSPAVMVVPATPTVVPATPTTEPTRPTAAPATAAAATASPGAADVTVRSPFYGYVVDLPARLVMYEPTTAARAWDGASQIDSGGALTDHVSLQDGRLLFAYGAPTELDLDAYAAAGQALKHEWHGCPEAPDVDTAMLLDGVPARLFDFGCGGLHLLSLYAVRDGFGLVVNLMSPPGAAAEDVALFMDLLAGTRWQS